ncbi:MAG: hypothetical protein J3K34DRAFT_413973 [Monoraphidium minutum]|nr:MAG: hypothetical protein J3K34DRAFT_413973 [Monoraphidium minutum]
MVRSTMSFAPSRIGEPARVGGFRAGQQQQERQQGLIKLNARTGLPSGYAGRGDSDGAGSSGGEGSEEGDESGGEGEPLDEGAARPRGESADERRARKAAVKEAQREARSNKKQLKELFKKEAGRQKAQGANARRGTTIAIP